MQGKRLLRIGPHGPSVRDRTIAEAPRDEASLWLVASDLARDQLRRDLAWISRGPGIAMAWTWADLWDEVRRRGDGPARPSPAAVRAVLSEAIDRERRAGRLKILANSAESPGFRRQLRARFAAWGRSGRPPSSPPPGDDRIVAEQWAIFGRYRRLLRELDAEDAEGFPLWAAHRFATAPPEGLGGFGRVVVLEPPPGRVVLSALEAFHRRSDSLTVTLEYDDHLIPREAYFEADSLRETLLEWGFDEDEVAADPGRPEGLDHLGRSLFRDDGAEPSRRAEGLMALGAPRGEGSALVVARRVRDLLRDGAAPAEVLVLVPRVDEEARRIGETLASWGIPVEFGADRPLGGDPAVSAVRLAMAIPAGGWDAARVVRLLRNGQVRPAWDEAVAPHALSSAARTIVDTRVYRGRKAIRDGLRRLVHSAPPREHAEDPASRTNTALDRAMAAIRVFERLATVMEACARPGAWQAQVVRLATLAGELGIGLSPGLDAWFLALDDHGAILGRLGRGDEIWSWPEFVREANALAREAVSPPEPPRAGRIRVMAADLAEGASVRHVILANLAEGTFPSRGSAGDEDDPINGPLGREMSRMLRVVASAREGLTLAFPTADEKGFALLASGFLDDVRRVFTPEAWRRIETSIGRLDPVLPEGLAAAPAESRVRAVHEACLLGRFGSLDGLLRDPSHGQALAGTARALRLAHWRSRRGRFGPYDGRIEDERIKGRIAEEFGPGRAVLSASHLETLALCPFQFFQKYVLKLEPTRERDELEDDHTARGQLLHGALEHLHSRLRDLPGEPGQTLADRVEAEIGPAISEMIDAASDPASEIEAGLRAIEAERLRRTGRGYARQFRKYMEKDGIGAVSRHFEVAFGKADAEYGALRIGEPPRSIDLQGVIDRIDLIERDGRPLFRVIDYKTGAVPRHNELSSGEKLQLSLYALAAERVILADHRASPLDAAYWEVRDKGFRKMHAMTSPSGDVDATWSRFAGDLESYVLALVDRLRDGDFPVAPRPADCTRLCDFRFVCRVAQVKRAAKVWPRLPHLGGAR